MRRTLDVLAAADGPAPLSALEPPVELRRCFRWSSPCGAEHGGDSEAVRNIGGT